METQYKNFVPLFEKYKNVRLCVENDSHTCKVTWPIVSSSGPLSDEGFERNDEKGIVYAGEGCWGAPLRAADDSKSWTRHAEGVNQFNWIFISKEKRLCCVAVCLCEQGNQGCQFIICSKTPDLTQIFFCCTGQQVFEHRPTKHFIYNTSQPDNHKWRGVQEHFFP